MRAIGPSTCSPCSVQRVSSNCLARADSRCAPRVALDDLRVWSNRRMVSYSCPCLLQAEGGVSGRLGILGFDHASESATSSKLPRDFCVHRPAGLYDIVQNAIDRVFIKDAKIAVCVEVHF